MEGQESDGEEDGRVAETKTGLSTWPANLTTKNESPKNRELRAESRESSWIEKKRNEKLRLVSAKKGQCLGIICLGSKHIKIQNKKLYK